MGEVFAGRYELIDQIGLGGMGSIWRVRDLRTGGVVAAKVLRQSDAVAVLRFVREQAVRIHHPHIIVPLGWAGEDGRVLFTMPVVEGGSVSTLIGDFGALPPLFVSEVIRQLADALSAVHAARVVHRDLKPSNILLDPTGTGRPHAYLTDFGIAVDLDGPRFTTTGAVAGTPGYLAPELLRFDDPTPASDLYALGMVAAAMLRGARPERVDAGAVPVGCPPALWSLAVDLVADDPAARPALGEVAYRLAAPELAWTPGAADGIEVFRQVDALDADDATVTDTVGADDATATDTLVATRGELAAVVPAEGRRYPALLVASGLAVVAGAVLLVLSLI